MRCWRVRCPSRKKGAPATTPGAPMLRGGEAKVRTHCAYGCQATRHGACATMPYAPYPALLLNRSPPGCMYIYIFFCLNIYEHTTHPNNAPSQHLSKLYLKTNFRCQTNIGRAPRHSRGWLATPAGRMRGHPIR